VHIWAVDKQRLIVMQELNNIGTALGKQVSFSNVDSNNILVTGDKTYKFFTIKESILSLSNKALNKKETSSLSDNYTSHIWLPLGRILVGTNLGQIIFCDQFGEYKKTIADNPNEGFYIEKFLIYSKGFIIGGDKGQMRVYNNTGEPNNPYVKTADLPDLYGEKSAEQKEIITQHV
jgi:hypothetical protein